MMRYSRILAVALVGWGCRMEGNKEGLGSSEETCKTCSISFDTVATLKGLAYGGASTTIARGPDGDFYLAAPGDSTLRVFSQDGHFARHIGGPGAAPGKYEKVRNILFDEMGGTHVLDAGLPRHTSYDKHGNYSRGQTAPTMGGYGSPAVLLPDGRLVVNVRPGAITDSTDALVVVDTSGKASSLGGQGEPASPRKRWLSERLLWGLPGGGVLVVRPYAFTLDVYDSRLEKKDSIVLRGEWIPSDLPKGQPSDGLFDQPYTPQVRAVWMDSERLLWVQTMIPIKSWSPAGTPKEMSKSSLQELVALSERPRAETIIQVFDLDGRQLIAMRRLDLSPGLPFGAGYYASRITDSTGEQSVSILRVHLNREREN